MFFILSFGSLWFLSKGYNAIFIFIYPKYCTYVILFASDRNVFSYMVKLCAPIGGSIIASSSQWLIVLFTPPCPSYVYQWGGIKICFLPAGPTPTCQPLVIFHPPPSPQTTYHLDSPPIIENPLYFPAIISCVLPSTPSGHLAMLFIQLMFFGITVWIQ